MLKLKHLDLITSTTDVLDIANSVYGFSKLNAIQKIIKFRSIVKSATLDMMLFEECDIGNLSTNTFGKFKVPDDIDLITFGARQEQEHVIRNIMENDLAMQEHISKLISITCYQEITGKPFNEDAAYDALLLESLELPILEAIGLYNFITQQVIESNKLWGSRFEEYGSTDHDYIASGGGELSKFAVISTIEFLCSKFNVDNEGAWNMPNIMVQSSLWKHYIEEDVKEKMAKLQEVRARAKARRH